MKKIGLFVLLFLLVTSFSANATNPGKGKKGNHYGQIKNGNNGHNGHRNNVGAPLDGGLLTVLGVAGVAYFAARKKGKDLES